MPSKEDLNRLIHMLEAAREALGYVQGLTREDLRANRPIAHSVVRCLEIVGEAASKVSPRFREQCPAIDWQNIVGMRNRLIHAYFDINLNIVWRTATEELPQLIAELEPIVKPPSQSPSGPRPAGNG